MDVHPPHKPITNTKEFFLHLLTITIGLLIAVGIEGMVEYFHHRHLVHEAQENLRGEIEHNHSSMSSALGTVEEEQAAIDKNIAVLQRIRANPDDKDAQNGPLNAHFDITTLDNTAWKAAQATGAMSYMPYDKAETYASIYSLQDAFDAAQNKQLEDVALFMGMIEKNQGGSNVKLSRQQAEEELALLGTWKMHLVWGHLSAKICDADYKAFLEGKPAPKSMHEEIK